MVPMYWAVKKGRGVFMLDYVATLDLLFLPFPLHLCNCG